MKKLGIFLLGVLTLGGIVMAMQSPLFAATPQTYLPLTCDRSKGNYKPMTTLVLVPLDNVLRTRQGDSAQDVAKALFYEFAYVRGNNVSAINAISHNGEIAYLSCDYPDYLSNIVTSSETGYFILGVHGNLPVIQVQALVDSLKIQHFQQAELVTTTEEKNTTIALANSKVCGDLCHGLRPSSGSIASRAYKVTVENPNYSKSVRQKELVSFSIKVKNDSDFPIYANGNESLYLAPAKSGISQLYHSSWVAPSLIARIPGILLPGEETAISATLGAPLRPGVYKESLVLKIGGTVIGKALPVTFTVENDNYKLARITSKDGSPYANMRQTPSLGGTVIGRLDVGAYVIVRGYQDAWVRIETKEGRVGWVYKPFIREL